VPAPLPETVEAERAPGLWVALVDSGGLGEALEAGLRTRGDTWVPVRRGEYFRAGPGPSFTVRPGSEEDFAAVARELEAAGLRPAGLLHLWSCDHGAGA